MKTLQNPILVAVDLEPGFEDTLEEGERVARAVGVELTVLHAVQVPTMPQFGDDTTAAREQAEVRCRELTRRRGAPVSPDPVVGIARPGALVLETVRARPVSLVFLGSHAETLDRLLLDSTVSSLLLECPRPVWVVRPRRRADFSRILVAVDTSRAAGEALQLAAALARSLGARLDVMRVFPEGPDRPASLPRQQEELRRYAAGFDLGGVEPQFVAWEGEPGERILQATTARSSDLLVLGSTGRRGLGRWLKRPMGERVAPMVPCSLLSVPSA